MGKLSVYDTVAYMSVPATLFLLPIAMCWQKAVPGVWPDVFGAPVASDWQILQKVYELSPQTFGLFVLSGIFSFAYNLVQFSIVHALSPSATAFGGNFNKAALIFLTLLLPFLRVHELPGPPCIQVIWGAVIINIIAFSFYSYLQIKAKETATKVPVAQLLEDQESTEDGETGASGSCSSSEEEGFLSTFMAKLGFGESNRGTRELAT